jgi:hypothetical protein
MTTTAARNATHDRIACDIRRCSEAEGRVAHQGNDWRMDGLERAGELAQAGLWAESREAAEKARQ